jgi:hypothetical protein
MLTQEQFNEQASTASVVMSDRRCNGQLVLLLQCTRPTQDPSARFCLDVYMHDGEGHYASLKAYSKQDLSFEQGLSAMSEQMIADHDYLVQ